MAKSLGAHFSTIELYQPPRSKKQIMCQVVADERAVTGRPHNYLRAVLSSAGLWPEDLLWSGTNEPVVRSPFLLLVGKEAMKMATGTKHPGLTIARARGCAMLMRGPRGDCLGFAIMHPESVLIGHNPLVKKDLLEDVKFWAQVVRGEITIDEALARPHACADCGGVYGQVVERVNGVPWCAKCWGNEQARVERLKKEGTVVRMVDGKGKYAGKARVGEDQGRLDV